MQKFVVFFMISLMGFSFSLSLSAKRNQKLMCHMEKQPSTPVPYKTDAYNGRAFIYPIDDINSNDCPANITVEDKDIETKTYSLPLTDVHTLVTATSTKTKENCFYGTSERLVCVFTYVPNIRDAKKDSE